MEFQSSEEKILIVDFGSQVTKLIARRIRDFGVYSEIITAEQAKEIKDFKNIVKEKTNKDFPQNVDEQLLGAISAVFLSWESNSAKVYRKINQIPSEGGTAVNVQSMVFGNMGNDCATGVVFTRNPSDGLNDIYGEYLIISIRWVSCKSYSSCTFISHISKNH